MPLTDRSRTLILRIGSFVLAGLFLWLALRHVDFGAVWNALTHGNWWWLLPLMAITLLSHWLRAIRWSIMLEALPERKGATDRVSIWIAFVSIMIGYMANYAGPRLGEVIRTGTVSSHEGLRFSSVLGTVVTGRILDMGVLLIAIATLPLLYGDRFLELIDLLVSPSADWLGGLGSTMIGALVILVGILVFWGIRFLVRGEKRTGRIRDLLSSFRAGLVSVLHTGRPTAIVLVTVGIWVCYGLMAWLPFVLLAQAGPFGIGPIDAWGLMTLGAVGMTIPSPGGIGTYHFITISALGMLHGMPEVEAATYALLAHTGQMLLYILAGFAGFLYLGTTASKHVHASQDVE